MSRAHHDATNVPNPGFGAGDYQYPPQSAQNQASHGVSNFVDGSGPIFSMYLEVAAEEDKKMAESWKADADGILIFTGLFSAAVASLISVSIQDIRPNPQDTSNFYLSNIYQTLADPNRSNISNSLPASPPPFSPPNYAVWVNALWFLSLVISITCALLATLLQQWARRYLKVTQPRYSLHKRSRIRAFFAEGIDKFFLPWAVEALPTLVHVSLFSFFSGLVVFLCNVDLTIFKLILSWVCVCTSLYGCITFIPIFRHDSPYYTPLSLPAWHIVTGIQFVTFQLLRWFAHFPYFSYGAWSYFRDLEDSYRKQLMQGMQKTAEETALDLPSEIDTRAFLWTFDSLDEDHELERFFSGLPGFRTSKVIRDPLLSLTYGQKHKLLEALIGLLDRTFSSDLLPERVKSQRAIICANAIDLAVIPGAFWWILRRIVSENQYGPVQSAEIVRFVRGRGNIKDVNTTMVIGAIVSSIVARVQRHDDSWFILASNELGVPESVLRDYAAQGDSLSLAILIHITRQQFSHFQSRPLLQIEFSKVLEATSKFNVQDTSPELQHEFCALWNQIVLKVRNDDDRRIAWSVLRAIRNVYIDLHKGTDAAPTRFSASTGDRDYIMLEPSSYPFCNIPGHHPHSTHHIRDVSSFTTFVHTALHDHDNSALVPFFHASSPDTPPSSAHTPLRIDEKNLTDVPPFDDNISVPLFLQPVDQTTTESCRIPATSPNPVITHATNGSIDTSTKVMRPSTPDPSASNPSPKSNASTFPPEAAVVPHTVDRRTPSDGPDVPSSPPTAVFDDMSPIESHPPLLTPVTPDPSCPLPSSAPDLGATSGEGGVKAALHKERDALDAPSAAPDIPLQSPSLSPVTDIAIAGVSWRSLGAENTGDHPPYPSHGQYDIV